MAAQARHPAPRVAPPVLDPQESIAIFKESSPMQLRPPTDSAAIVANARSIAPAIEGEANKFAEQRRLTNEIIALMRRAGLFRIAFPKAWGGPEMDILSQCEVMETLGYHD